MTWAPVELQQVAASRALDLLFEQGDASQLVATTLPSRQQNFLLGFYIY